MKLILSLLSQLVTFPLSLVKGFLSLPCYSPNSSVFALLPSLKLLMSFELSSVLSLEQSVKSFVVLSRLLSCYKLSSFDYLRRTEEQHTKAFICSKLLSEGSTTLPLVLLGINRLKKALLTLFC